MIPPLQGRFDHVLLPHSATQFVPVYEAQWLPLCMNGEFDFFWHYLPIVSCKSEHGADDGAVLLDE